MRLALAATNNPGFTGSVAKTTKLRTPEADIWSRKNGIQIVACHFNRHVFIAQEKRCLRFPKHIKSVSTHHELSRLAGQNLPSVTIFLCIWNYCDLRCALCYIISLSRYNVPQRLLADATC